MAWAPRMPVTFPRSSPFNPPFILLTHGKRLATRRALLERSGSAGSAATHQSRELKRTPSIRNTRCLTLGRFYGLMVPRWSVGRGEELMQEVETINGTAC